MNRQELDEFFANDRKMAELRAEAIIYKTQAETALRYLSSENAHGEWDTIIDLIQAAIDAAPENAKTLADLL